jgi:hypothetical protein
MTWSATRGPARTAGAIAGLAGTDEDDKKSYRCDRPVHLTHEIDPPAPAYCSRNVRHAAIKRPGTAIRPVTRVRDAGEVPQSWRYDRQVPLAARDCSESRRTARRSRHCRRRGCRALLGAIRARTGAARAQRDRSARRPAQRARYQRISQSQPGFSPVRRGRWVAAGLRLLRWLVVPVTRSIGGACRTESPSTSPTSTHAEPARVPDRCQMGCPGAVPGTAAGFTSVRVALRGA